MENDTKGQVENILAELGKRIDHLIQEMNGAREDVRKDVEKKIKELKKRKAKIEEDFGTYKEKNGDKWKDAINHLVAAAHELKKAVESVFKDSTQTKL